MDDYLAELLSLESSGLARVDLARRLEERAHQSAPGSEERSAFLNAAGDHWGYAEQTTSAEAAYRASIANRPEPGYAEAALVLLLLQDERESDADALLTSLLHAARSDELTPDTYEIVGEVLEEAGRAREALRWFTMPLRDVDPEDLDGDDLPLLHGRYRVRRDLGLHKDRFDLVCDQLMVAEM